MRGPSRARDDDLDAEISGRLRVFEQQIRRAMRRHDTRFVLDAEFAECVTCVLHRVPVGPGPHDDSNLDTHRESLPC